MKNFKKWMIAKLLKWAKILDIEKALRDKYHEGVEATEKKYANRVNVWYDPTVRSYPQQEQKSAVYEPPPPRTDQVQVLHLRTGEWSRRWRETHGMKPKQEVIRTNTAPLDPATDFPPRLLDKTPTIHDLTSDELAEITKESPAIVALLHQEREQRRHAG